MCVGEKIGSHGKVKCTNFILNTLEAVALKNANKACRGFIYEPKVPKKLKE